MREISFGTVLNVVEDNPAQWSAELELATELPGLGHVEVWLEHLPNKRGIKQLGSMLDGVGVTVHGPFVDMNLATSWEDLGNLAFTRASSAVEVAGELGAKVFTLHAGKYPIYEDQTRPLLRFAERLSRLAENADPIVAVENLKAKESGVSRETIARHEDVVRLVEMYPRTRITVDVAHAVQNLDDPVVMMDELGERVACAHVHDATPGGRSHRALGDGMLNFEAVVCAILRNRPQFVTLETLGAVDTQRSWHTLHESLGRLSLVTRVA